MELEPDENLVTAATDAYLETLVWQSTLMGDRVVDGELWEDGTPLEQLNFDASEVPDETKETIRDQVASVLAQVMAVLERPLTAEEAAKAGQDFCLSRNRHGAGFFDSEWLDANGTNRARELQRLAVVYGPHTLDVSIDGTLYDAEGA